ncbi:chitobiosyldiphosphodolichol beta-mannosyltransferase [Metopolophium dirhodum]|uniref:chitobiosyldiphosphodolichol beta-mannosyltransferase n=1 Tax=Metopolophium dirhodum TaxID=44670 RepID=UPI0029904158|nr:chitobiosyldiphosphodolichol beta-mannosyltransferase [Metopolophium dirhodum]
MGKKSVCVVVLGDIGRSPRMQYHAQSLIRQGFDVDIVGYTDSPVLDDLKENATIIGVPKPFPFDEYVPRTIAFLFKVVWQTLTLFWAILVKRKSDIVLVQNPPAIPTLAVCWFYCLLVNAKFIIDWHNYAYSILALTLGSNAPLVKLSLFYEHTFGKLADFNLCVTKAMKDDLHKKWNIEATTLYDRPGPQFKTITLSEKHNLLEKMNLNDFTKLSESGEVQLKPDRPSLLVSSTSWTPDEDFSILLKALQKYDESDDIYPKLICVITGRGPLKYHYQHKILKLKWKKVSIITPWLENNDYPLLLACADLGVCLHASSSGLDLPMKVIDMYGVGLPVCAYDFKCLNELVRHNENGLVFSNENQLALHIMTWFKNFPSEICEKQSRFCKEIDNFRAVDWHTNWMNNAYPIFSNDNN